MGSSSSAEPSKSSDSSDSSVQNTDFIMSGEKSSGIHLGEFHSNFHSSGMCIGTLLLSVILLILFFYCMRKKLFKQHQYQNTQNQPSQFQQPLPTYHSAPQSSSSYGIIKNFKNSFRNGPGRPVGHKDVEDWKPPSDQNI